ncbi:hypothetical protein SCP_0205980 [Sparassis crispa]|uniref:Uncharacterized protein n=1 Tax=Sparassis crispa TaxID=139825 RepID=A0A401GB46_9APHY|nr:hypothetical protein SCP_0205980 [Sparassis crispa]GBE79400.1 hypothetical protein SCP_0205980 [Sparassis crispa]
MAKKKGPPYKDDPQCKYIVIDDPWPGNLTGKERNNYYYNWIGAWVFFMLGKKAGEPICIYSVNTRREVIVKLSEGIDVTSFLGAHHWSVFLRMHRPTDAERVSCVFPYNYRMKGHPENHNWTENFPIGGEPPPHLKFPVKFPYPPPTWASPDHKNAKDISLPLPASRPQPPPNAFDPYQPPAHYDPALAADPSDAPEEPEEESEEEPEEVVIKAEPEPELYVRTKNDPYEEEDAALQFLKAEPVDDHVPMEQEITDTQIKQEVAEANVKQEPPEAPIKREEQPEENTPSEAFMAAFARLQQRALENSASQAPTRPPDTSASPHISVIEPYIPTQSGTSAPRVKPEPQEGVIPPFSHTHAPRYNPGPVVLSTSGSGPSALGMRVKPEPEDRPLPSGMPARYGDARQRALESTNTNRTSDPRLLNPELSSKRVKSEDEEQSTKRIKTEEYDR